MSGFIDGYVSVHSSAERQTGRHVKCVGSDLGFEENSVI